MSVAIYEIISLPFISDWAFAETRQTGKTSLFHKRRHKHTHPLPNIYLLLKADRWFKGLTLQTYLLGRHT